MPREEVMMALSADERRARDVLRKRAARAAEREAKLAAGRTVDPSTAPATMRRAVEDALAAMKWLVASDAASIAQARTLAEQIDVLTQMEDFDRVLVAQRALSKVLSDLGGTPVMRVQHELRSLRLKKGGGSSGGGDDGEGEQAALPGNVSAFRRPVPRKRRA